MKVLVCGSRDWTDEQPIRLVLGGLRDVELGCRPIVIHGAARGADTTANKVAANLGCEVWGYPADWDAHGKAAGPIRNKLMLDEGKPNLVVAFKDGFDSTLSKGGTEHMVKIAKAAGIPTYVVSHG